MRSVTATTSEVRLAVELEKEQVDGYWIASCPELPGASSQGTTAEDAMTNLADAVDGILRLKLRSRYQRLHLHAVTETQDGAAGALTTTISV